MAYLLDVRTLFNVYATQYADYVAYLLDSSHFRIWATCSPTPTAILIELVKLKIFTPMSPPHLLRDL